MGFCSHLIMSSGLSLSKFQADTQANCETTQFLFFFKYMKLHIHKYTFCMYLSIAIMLTVILGYSVKFNCFFSKYIKEMVLCKYCVQEEGRAESLKYQMLLFQCLPSLCSVYLCGALRGKRGDFESVIRVDLCYNVCINFFILLNAD